MLSSPWRAAFVSMLTLSVLQAAVPGTPEPPHPGPTPTGWAELGNDDLTIEGAEGTSPDDHRTNAITIGLTIADAVIVIDDSMLTDRMRSTRSDELTMTIGWLPLGRGTEDHAWYAIGAGSRLSGNLEGDRMQSDWHRLLSLRVYRLTYESDDAQPVAYVYGAYPWWPLADYGAELSAGALASPLGEGQLDVAARAIVRSDSGQNRLWAGLRFRARSGRAASNTASAVASFERGVWADVGWSMGFVTLHALHDFSNGQSYGMLALEWAR